MAWNTKKNSSTAKTTENKTDRTKEALSLLETGIKKLTSSDEWQRWLKCQAALHQYSFSNCLLILAQMPNATRVAGFKSWQKLGRQVRKGEKAIWILAPRFFKPKGADEQAETDNNVPSEDEEQVKIYFKPCPVFDISQTEGEDLPAPVRKLQGDDDGGLFDQLKAFSEARGCAVSVEVIKRSANGYFSPVENRIVVAEGLSPVQRAKTLAHEVAHSILHRDHEVYAAHRADCELEAESTAFVILNHFGLDSGDYSFGYLANWQGGDEKAIKALKACASRIHSTAKTIIDGISGEETHPEDEAVAA